jgi:hypothetical protein
MDSGDEVEDRRRRNRLPHERHGTTVVDPLGDEPSGAAAAAVTVTTRPIYGETLRAPSTGRSTRAKWARG